MEYTDVVMENFTCPKHVGEIEDANGVGQVGSPACGDIMKIFLKINGDGVIEDASFKTFGCGAAVASSSMATDMIIGKTIEEAGKFKNSDVVDALGGLPAEKIHCSVLAAEAIQAAIEDYHKNKA
ncbi:iron-sulfur cluster assembly scaffold protein [Acetobacterium sp.]|jgi:nitrogen fixation NifU-like protein|uniref:iron-sulfur cluster assembly scaffold protein n=1 Tax=Acetobacterium sp. TaxID=1872094 RepID=UPI000CBB442F|nr:iron-sulfur cluster assembly scaffold protein [Acetobacterium sp.]MDO9492072.1 iron-sulfur cluster assembly scaffold protein [Acetobacterium sp.]PKM71304.1 MAG: iron-sulfur cluster assembly scaffold protein [Firmicutes bacterium HGW-Firmicutes-17]